MQHPKTREKERKAILEMGEQGEKEQISHKLKQANTLIGAPHEELRVVTTTREGGTISWLLAL